MRKSYEVASMAVSQAWSILLYGPVGAGKTALINKLAQIGGNRGIYFIIYSIYKLRLGTLLEDFVQANNILGRFSPIDRVIGLYT